MQNGFYTPEKAALRTKAFSELNSATAFESIFFEILRRNVNPGQSILDIGTGNGFVLRKFHAQYPTVDMFFYGIDLSEHMINSAKYNFPEGLFAQGDNYALPFSENFFDIVVAKNVTQFSSREVNRVLKAGCHFIFREYGAGKGLLEVADLFKDRLIRSRNPSFYIQSLVDEGFENVALKEYHFDRQYSLDNLLEIVKTFPFIKDYSIEDEQKIKDRYYGKSTITITSDPILIMARKKNGTL